MTDTDKTEFYHGTLGREILADLTANSAYITPEDLAHYRVRGGVTGA